MPVTVSAAASAACRSSTSAAPSRRSSAPSSDARVAPASTRARTGDSKRVAPADARASATPSASVALTRRRRRSTSSGLDAALARRARHPPHARHPGPRARSSASSASGALPPRHRELVAIARLRRSGDRGTPPRRASTISASPARGRRPRRRGAHRPRARRAARPRLGARWSAVARTAARIERRLDPVESPDCPHPRGVGEPADAIATSRSRSVASSGSRGDARPGIGRSASRPGWAFGLARRPLGAGLQLLRLVGQRPPATSSSRSTASPVSPAGARARRALRRSRSRRP